jgi:hypothetical protein
MTPDWRLPLSMKTRPRFSAMSKYRDSSRV